MGSRATPAAVVADRLHSAAIHLLRGLRRNDAALGVGPAKLSALSVLVFGGPRSVGALARAEQVRLPTMSRLVTALERDGLVTRVPDPKDGRSAIVHPTGVGRSVLRRGRDRRIADLTRRLDALTATDLEAIDRATALVERLT
jgi:DNA-binding MarR family transcriptional regulator